ncbi:MAG: hypothetical protein V1915_01775 [Candidatus Bathyarchaeota archaeon]
MLYTVRGLVEGSGGVTIRVRVVAKEQPRVVKTKDGAEHVVVDSRVGDRTGMIQLALWDNLTHEVETGDIIDIENGYVSRFKGYLFLNVGKYGRVEKVEEPGFPSVEEIVARSGQRGHRRRSFLNKP